MIVQRGSCQRTCAPRPENVCSIKIFRFRSSSFGIAVDLAVVYFATYQGKREPCLISPYILTCLFEGFVNASSFTPNSDDFAETTKLYSQKTFFFKYQRKY